MFPFSGQLSSVAATNHYNISDVMAILDACAQLKLEVIPLVQTFGHMEFILKLPEFAYLRDAEDMPESICSCHDHTMPLIEKYINQVMALHPNARYLHIGCDEVFHMGECESCALKGLYPNYTLKEYLIPIHNYVLKLIRRFTYCITLYCFKRINSLRPICATRGKSCKLR